MHKSLLALQCVFLSGFMPRAPIPASRPRARPVTPKWCAPLCRGLDLCQRLALLEPPLLLEAHHLEAVKVGQVLPPLDLIPLLGPVALLPLGVDV